MKHLARLSCGVALALAAPGGARAEAPAVLIFGGGWGPDGTQASIEAHVADLRSALVARSPATLFAGGGRGAPEVQEQDPATDRAEAVLGLVFDRLDGLGARYRAARIPAEGPASRDALLDALTALAAHPGGAVVFGAGHGAPASEEGPAALELWGPDDRLTVEELAAHLDRTPRRGPLAFVLGQCHGGAFAGVSRRAASGPIARPARCVLAAVPADRPAAGCTPDAGAPDARAYLGPFAEALAQPERADLDGDGRASLEEAHAHARVADDTVDVPVVSSELFLEDAVGARAGSPAKLPRATLLAWARPAERRVLERVLPADLAGAPGHAVERERAALRADLEQRATRAGAREAILEGVRATLLDRLLARFPSLGNPYHRESRRLLGGPATEIVRWLEAQPELAALEAGRAGADAEAEATLAVERRAARVERWLRAARTVLRERLLISRRDPLMRDLAALRACEAMTP